ncbi:hypothetical protein Fcan01_26240 [Folsomia candida]|uniref:Chitin-binding type-2 domain-containing protein n=1 Tax=Folsomia candida TaxID=158441 RepID=A0A226D2I1_FOLCA|nr:hypothetical protein Fcan01_26240 [Folsomia candida]
MMTAGSEPRPLLIVAHCLLLVTLGARVVSSAEEVAPTLRRTFSDEELVNFCSTRHTGAQAVKPHGYIHPIYCSRFIMCAKLKSAEGKDQISAEEKICPRCPESVTKLANDPNQPSKNRSSAVCKFGHLHFDEESQTCRPQKRQCIQNELPSNNVWGRKDLSSVCVDVPIGSTQTFADPYHCGKYVTCHRDKDYFRDLWISAEACPSCESTTPGCPDGYMHYNPNGTDGPHSLCHLTNVLPPETPPCNPDTRKTHPISGGGPEVLSSTTPPILDVLDNIPKSYEVSAAKTFCIEKEQVTKRYAVPDKCNSYFFCYADLYDRDGDMRPLNKVHHFQFNCDTCSEIHSESGDCNATTGGETNFLQFDFEQQTCVVPTNGTCLHDGTFKVNEAEVQAEKVEVAKHSWKVPMLSQEEVNAFCKEKGSVAGNFKHPKDTTCARYVECWETMGCHHSYKGNKTACPAGHLYFDPSSGTCQPGKNDAACNPEVPEPTVLPDLTTPSSMQYAPEDKADIPLEEISDEPVHPDLMASKECNLKNYVQRGYCKNYFTCDRKTRMEKQHTCSGRLYWNPDVGTVHGGVCDFLRNIDNFTLYQYKKDPGCPLNLAYFRVDEKECSNVYFYHHPTRTEGKEVKLTCPEDLLWSKEVQTCVKCHQIMKTDGVTPCCEGGQAEAEDADSRRKRKR